MHWLWNLLSASCLWVDGYSTHFLSLWALILLANAVVQKRLRGRGYKTPHIRWSLFTHLGVLLSVRMNSARIDHSSAWHHRTWSSYSKSGLLWKFPWNTRFIPEYSPIIPELSAILFCFYYSYNYSSIISPTLTGCQMPMWALMTSHMLYTRLIIVPYWAYPFLRRAKVGTYGISMTSPWSIYMCRKAVSRIHSNPLSRWFWNLDLTMAKA